MKLIFYNINHVNLLSFKKLIRVNSTLTNLALNDVEKDSFPTIKPKYPPGLWSSDFDESAAWAINEYSNKLLSLPSAKEKLEHLAGTEPTILWLVKATSDRLKNLDFYKYITKTHVLVGLPEAFDKIDISNHLKFKELYTNCFSEEFKYFNRKQIESKSKISLCNYAIGSLLRNILTRSKYISRNCIIDEEARIESFWRVSGFVDNKAAKGTWEIAKLKEGIDAGFLQFQFKHITNYQIRSKHPLPEFLEQSDNACSHKVVLSPEFSPHVIGLEPIQERPISISGHWIGSNYSFSIGCVHLMEENKAENTKALDAELVEEDEVQFAMATCYASCRAQAANHGFNDFHDVTYPITTKCLLVNKNKIRLFAYQLNTMQVWNTANPLNNVLWTSPSINFFNIDDDYRLTEEALDCVLKFACQKPVDRGIDYQPYIFSENNESKTLKINRIGEPIIDQPPVERFKYPKNSIYYRTFI